MKNLVRYFSFFSLVISGIALFLVYRLSIVRMRYLLLILIGIFVYLLIVWLFWKKSASIFQNRIEIVGLVVIPLLLSGIVMFKVARRSHRISSRITNVNNNTFINKANIIEKEFNDVQKVQIEAAKRKGVSPISTREDATRICAQISEKGRLEKISSNEYYHIQPLEYSCPYLVPDAKRVLEDCGREFQTLTGSKSKPIVTSVLRTQEDVRKLQKVNSNATSNSCHCYGTTFDISYTAFKKDLLASQSDEELRLALAQALAKLRKEGRCYVKFEKSQKCYHITVR